MKLQPSIASYSGETAAAIRAYLSGAVLDVVASVAAGPRPSADIDAVVIAELEEMHVLRHEAGTVRLQTAAFLEPDIERIIPAVSDFAAEVAQGAMDHGADFRGARPEAACFLGGVIGLQQGVGNAFQAQKLAGEWKEYQGKYARSKVDFDEVCAAREALGPDLQNKSVLRGGRFTAVFIGPGGTSFRSLAFYGDPPDESRRYLASVNRHLVDAYALLLQGDAGNENLLAAAQIAGLYSCDGAPRTSVITWETMEKYRPAIERLTAFASSYYAAKLPVLCELLSTTASGRQGVSAANQMMHLFRYVRRATARELYAAGFLTDTVPEDGSLTVFYENDIPYLNELI
ncbi:MAG: hypothetical protein Q8P31_05660 [Bacillota bacterium]|nr:hypothetical protein [Bacillota bacterium]